MSETQKSKETLTTMPKKVGVGPRPNGDYLGGEVEQYPLEGKKGHDKNAVTKVAEAPEVADREHGQPSMGLARKKDDSHGHEYPGRTYKTQIVKDAVAKPVDRKVIDQQLGSNGHLGN